MLCIESREAEENLERWKSERRGIKLNHNKTEYMCVNERDGSRSVRLQGAEIKSIYLAPEQWRGWHVQTGWNRWRRVVKNERKGVQDGG